MQENWTLYAVNERRNLLAADTIQGWGMELPQELTEIIDTIQSTRSKYYRLTFVVGPTNSGKTSTLRSIGDTLGNPPINLNLELSRRMLDLTEQQRSMQLPILIQDVISESKDGAGNLDVVILDNTEILFDPRLGNDPLRLLQDVARNQLVVASWNGVLEDGFLKYAVPGHPEYRRYQATELVIVSMA